MLGEVQFSPKENKEYIIQGTAHFNRASVTGNSSIALRLDYVAGGTVTISELRLYKGTKDLGWTPAPEDLQSGIDAVDAALTEFKQSTTSQLSVLEGEINAKVSQTTLTQTLSNYVTTTTLNQKVSEINQTMDGITSRVSKTETSISGLTTRVTTAESTIEQQANEIALRVTQSQVDTTVGNAIDGLEIGGRNYFGFNKGVNFSIMSNKNGTNAMDRSIRGVTMKTAQLLASGTIVGRIQTLNLPENGWYTFSAWMKATAACNVQLDICDKGNISFALTAEYQYVTISANVNDHITDQYKGFVDFAAGANGVPAGTTIYAKDVKIEKGEKATDWTPAPEDYSTTEELTSSFTMTAGGISLLGKEISLTGKVTFAMLAADAQGTINGKVDTTTIIEGGKIKTSMIDVDNLYVKHLEGATGDFTGEVNADSGKIGRWIIDGYNLKTENNVIPSNPTDGGVGSRLTNGGLQLTSGSDAGTSGILPSSSGAAMTASLVAKGDNALLCGAFIGAEYTGYAGNIANVVALELSAKSTSTNPLGDPPLAIKVDAGLCDFKGIQNLSFGRLNVITVNAGVSNIDVYAYTYPTTKSGMYIYRPLDYQYVNCIRLIDSTANYVVNICAPPDGDQLIIVVNNTNGTKRVCMTRNGDDWYTNISAYDGKIFYANGGRNSYGGHLVSDLYNLSG